MYNGWIKLHRSLLDWEWFDEPNTFRLFMYCLLRANHKPKNYRGKLVQVGSFLTSREALSRDTGLSERQVRTALDNLKTTNELSIVSSRQGTVIQVNNYEKYQSASNETTDQTSNKRPTNDQQTTSNNNDKNEEEIKEDTPPTPKGAIPTFDEFLEHAKEKADIAEVELNESEVRLKYESWKDAGWKTGGKNSRKIKNWKNTLTNSIKFMSKPKTTKSGIYAGMTTDEFIKQQWSEVMADAKSIGDDIHE